MDKIKSIKARIGAHWQDCQGLTLIEVSIGLVILGILSIPLMQAYKVEMKNRSFAGTKGAINESITAINLFYNSGNGFFPCPTNLSLQQGDAGFGQAGDCTLANLKLCTDPTWFADEGICKTEDSLSAVVIGGVPFSTLQTQQESALDYWGNKIIYAVSINKTDPLTFAAPPNITTFSVDNPGLVASGSADGIADPMTSPYSIFLYSTGASGTGGITKDGVRISDCGTAATGYDNENCDFDDTFFFDIDPTDLQANAVSEQPGPQFFDDITGGQISIPVGTWFADDDNASIIDRDYALTTAVRVGVGTSDPTFSLDVDGAIRVENTGTGTGNGWLKTDDICDENTSNCFDPELITGTEDAMDCESSADLYGTQGVMELSFGSVKCSVGLDNSGSPVNNQKSLRVDTSLFNENDCGATGQLVAGINASGDVICLTP